MTNESAFPNMTHEELQVNLTKLDNTQNQLGTSEDLSNVENTTLIGQQQINMTNGVANTTF